MAEGPFAKEAVDELVDCVTKTQFQNKLVIILAGYEHDINRLMSINPGLTSRFPEVIDFQSCFVADRSKATDQISSLRVLVAIDCPKCTTEDFRI